MTDIIATIQHPAVLGPAVLFLGVVGSAAIACLWDF
jgi:hypothetical protein